LAVALALVPASGAGAAVDEGAGALWAPSVVPDVPNWPDPKSVELGVRFITAEATSITGIRFYKGDMNTGTHFGTLWTENQEILATGEFSDETVNGWQDLTFDAPVPISPGQVYVASYWAPNGYYAAVNYYFADQGVTVGPITALGAVGADGNGVYSYSETGTFPDLSYRDSNYWVTPLWTTGVVRSVDAGADAGGAEGSAIALAGSASGLDDVAISFSWSVTTSLSNGGACVFSAPTSAVTDIICDDDGMVEATLTASDEIGSAVSDTVSIQVDNVEPSLVVTNGDGAPVAVGQLVSIPASVADPGTNDTLTCSYDWGDGEASAAVVPSGGECTATHAYATPDVYTVDVTVTDDDGGSASAETSVVVYDPTAGFVTGGGWFDSAAGAYKLDPAAEGRATFGFVSRYQRGATTPSGATAFVFRAGGFRFISQDYDWLVVTRSNYAKYKGTGTINGSGAYKFQIWAGDDDPDTFRIKIWTDNGSEELVYDNGMDQELGGGRIRIH
jgi:hypothetical protein